MDIKQKQQTERQMIEKFCYDIRKKKSLINSRTCTKRSLIFYYFFIHENYGMWELT